MACYYPIRAWKPDEGGKLVFAEKAGTREIEIPCSRCIGCRLERSRQWAVRCMHENQMHAESSFVTLTYDDDHLPVDNSLRYSDYQAFMKRLRQWNLRRGSGKLSFYMCGEYGEKLGRPHYHACIFGAGFPDRVVHKRLDSGHYLYRSPALASMWEHGFSSVGDVTFESAAYVARYVMKKVLGDQADWHYQEVTSDGEVFWRVPEFNRMSLNPAVGKRWYDRYKEQTYPRDYVVVRGRKVKPPRYYDLLQRGSPLGFDEVEYERFNEAMAHIVDSTPERLHAREIVARAHLNSKVRTLR